MSLEETIWKENEARKNKYIEKIISLISPIIVGLTFNQIDIVMTEAKDKILNSLVFTGQLYDERKVMERLKLKREETDDKGKSRETTPED